MGATPFRAVNWSPNELIGEDKMDQMAANMNYLRDYTPTTLYTDESGFRKPDKIRIASGRVIITARKTDGATVGVRFGNFFSSKCRPNIATGVVSEGQPRIFCVIKGIGTLMPDNRGFDVQVNIAAELKKNDYIKKSFYVQYIAMGY